MNELVAKLSDSMMSSVGSFNRIMKDDTGAHRKRVPVCLYITPNTIVGMISVDEGKSELHPRYWTFRVLIEKVNHCLVEKCLNAIVVNLVFVID